MRLVLQKLSGSMSVTWYRQWHYVFLRRALQQTLAQVGSAVVYAQCPLSALAALETRRYPSQRVVLAVHFNGSQADEWVDKGLIRRGGRTYRSITELERLVLPMVDGIAFVSDDARRNVMVRMDGLERIRNAVIHNFCSIPKMPAAACSADLVTVGSLETAKNHRFLLEVLAWANRMGRRFTLDVIGDGPCRASLKELSHSLRLDGQVRWMGKRSDVLEMLPRHRAYVHASTRESLCLSIIEAMGSGLAVIAGDIGGISELFEPGVEGMFWPLSNPRSAAGILIELFGDPERLLRMSTAARSRFLRTFDAAVMGPQLDQFLQGTSSDQDARLPGLVPEAGFP